MLSHNRSVRSRRVGGFLAVGLTLCCLGGCNNAGEGAVSGAALGALGGLAIGSLTGGSGTGAVIGAVAGGIGGLIIGDQNARNSSQQNYR